VQWARRKRFPLTPENGRSGDLVRLTVTKGLTLLVVNADQDSRVVGTVSAREADSRATLGSR
jgi:hypothetical protein